MNAVRGSQQILDSVARQYEYGDDVVDAVEIDLQQGQHGERREPTVSPIEDVQESGDHQHGHQVRPQRPGAYDEHQDNQGATNHQWQSRPLGKGRAQIGEHEHQATQSQQGPQYQ